MEHQLSPSDVGEVVKLRFDGLSDDTDDGLSDGIDCEAKVKVIMSITSPSGSLYLFGNNTSSQVKAIKNFMGWSK